MTDDAELLRRYAEDRSEDAFAELVRRHIGLVYGKALRSVGGDRQLAEDAVQVVYSLLAQKAGALCRRSTLASWLYVTTKFVAAKVARSEHRRRKREAEAESVDQVSGSSPAAINWDRLHPVLDEVMEELSEQDRTAVLLRFFEERTFGEIGHTLKISEEAVRKRVERALDRLHGLLAKRGVASTSSAVALLLSGQAAIAAPPGLALSVTTAILTHASAVHGGSFTALRLMQFMTKTKITAGLVGALAILAVGSAVHEVRRARQDDALLASGREQLTELQAQVNRLPQAKADSVLRPNHNRPARAIAAAAPGDQESAIEAQARRLADLTKDRQSSLFGDPDFQRLYQQAEQKNIRLAYGSLYQALHFSGDQIDQFEALLAQNAWARRDLAAAAADQGVAESDPAVRELKAKDTKQFEAGLVALLGDSGYAQYQQYQQQLPARGWVESLAAAVYYTDSPLTRPQAAQLLDILDVNDGDFNSSRSWEPQSLDWDAVSFQLESKLSPAQLAAWKAVAVQMQYQTEVLRAAIAYRGQQGSKP